ncbi:MAG: sigma-54 dependent transcriptional regulator [Candidatus Muirbacterium halophilum]|nr:sigma-54 dependent transcriptional regulator [Candidatus Muirbacterium halophilum]MCK9475334.1 sigma-54 dependent transcriptional regulator [Candidatus Muirbacterium halophilum]
MSLLIGKSENINNIRRLIKRAALSNGLPIFIFGESGTGKELIAREICKEANKNIFVPVNCGAIPRELLESELFGYEKGSFTGASNSYKGKIRESHNGVLFLDEIGEMECYLQPKLLRVLQEREVIPVGSSKSIKVDFLLISATNRNITKMVENGDFREDLFYRLYGININILPLRDRKEDILPLCEFFLKNYSKKNNKQTLKLGNKLKELIVKYNWPGNVRQLQSFIEREVFFSEPNNIILDHIPDFLVLNKAEENTDWNVFINEKIHIKKCLEFANWNIQKSSRLLGLSRATLYRKIKEYEIKK